MIIEHIDLDKSKPNKDFGKGFYLSESEMQATEMATFKSLLLGGEPVITKFEFDDAVMHDSALRIKVFDNYSEERSEYVFDNRDGNDVEKVLNRIGIALRDDVEQYDIVYGPIANDKIGLQIRKLKDGSIDKAEFLNRLKYMKGITFQYFFGTETAV